MKVNIYGRIGNEEMIISSVEIEYADTGNDDTLTITLKRGVPINPALLIAVAKNFAGMEVDLWPKYGPAVPDAINITLPKSHFWIEVRE